MHVKTAGHALTALKRHLQRKKKTFEMEHRTKKKERTKNISGDI